MDLKQMSAEELRARVQELNSSKDTDGADLDAILEEIRSINAELEHRAKTEAKKQEVRDAVAAGAGRKIERMENKMEVEVRNTPAYINAYANYIKYEDDKECRALLTENGSGALPVPTLVYDIVKHAWETEGIMSRVRKAYIRGNLKVGFEISATGAVAHTEGQSVNEETLTLGVATLIPKAIKKWISISDEAMDMEGEAFLRYIYEEVAYQIAKKAADDMVAAIVATSTSTASTTSPAQAEITATTITVGLVAQAIAQLSDEASNPVIIMNKVTWGDFKEAQYANTHGHVDVFEGLPVIFNNTLPAFSAATTGVTYAIVGDLGQGALANFPSGEEITFKIDENTLATSDLVRIIGREYVALGVVAPNAFTKIMA